MLTEKEAAKNGLSLAVRAGDLLFLSGQIGVEPDGTVPTDPARQFQLVFDGIAKVLQSHGCTAADVVDMNSFHVGYPGNMEAFAVAKKKFLGDNLPAWTAIGVAALGYPQSLVEVKVVARLKS